MINKGNMRCEICNYRSSKRHSSQALGEKAWKTEERNKNAVRVQVCVCVCMHVHACVSVRESEREREREKERERERERVVFFNLPIKTETL